MALGAEFPRSCFLIESSVAINRFAVGRRRCRSGTKCTAEILFEGSEEPHYVLRLATVA